MAWLKKETDEEKEKKGVLEEKSKEMEKVAANFNLISIINLKTQKTHE